MKKQLINKPMLQLLLVAGIAGAGAGPAAAVVQSSSEVWVGSSTTIQGNGGAASKVSIFAQRMVQPLATAGTVSGLQNAILSDSKSTWTDSQFGSKGIPAYVEFDNGWMADIADCSAANHCLNLAGGLGSAASVGNSYRIRNHFTIASMFGTNNEAGLQTGENLSEADNILIEVPETQQILTFFYYVAADGSYEGWLDATYTPAGNHVIYPEQGLMVRRRAASDLPLYLVGPVKTGASVVTVDQGYNLVGTLKSATALALSALNLYTGDPATGLACGSNLTESDNLLVIQPNGATTTFFYFKYAAIPSFEGWVDASFTPSSATQITPGSAFFIRRKAPNASFNWTIPAE